jgi:hypothetical protein
MIAELAMLIVGSALKGYAIEANDGRLGTVTTFLFDDKTWKIRWLVVDVGHWLTDRQVLIHPSAIGKPDYEMRLLPVDLTKAQVEASPDIRQDQPVTMQMEAEIRTYYDWNTGRGLDYYGAGIGGFATDGGSGTSSPVGDGAKAADTLQPGLDEGDPHLRSMTALHGYHIRATDGSIGHVENFLVEDDTWTVSYLIIDTRNWWPGAHVLISPYAVQSIEWGDHEVRLNVSREQVRASPPWNPVEVVEQTYERELHDHYGWRGYGW